MQPFETRQSRNGRPGTLDQPPAREDQFETGNQKAPSPDFRPALFAAYRDLSTLRHDFPLVLGWQRGEAVVRPLSELINEALRAIAPPGANGERLRCEVLTLEENVRGRAAPNTRQRLSDAWKSAEEEVLPASGETGRNELRADLAKAGAALPTDGDLVACDANATADVVIHLWRGAESRKARAFLRRIDRLIHRLRNLLKADAMRTPGAWTPESLQRTMGGAFTDAFDFEAMGKAVRSVTCRDRLPEKRRQRITEALSVLRSQKLFHPNDLSFSDYLFDRYENAIEAHEARLDEIATLLRAIGVAELEINNWYRESVHDGVLKEFNRHSLTPDQLSQFPCPLIVLREVPDADCLARIVKTVASGHPMKVVLVNDDLAESSNLATELASMAIGLNDVFVLQAAASSLGRIAETLSRGLGAERPAFFSFYSGCATHTPLAPPYLLAAAATESRVFPTFSFDPTGREWADQFALAGNPRPEQRWVAHPFTYETDGHQRVSEEVAFTPIDFIGCNRRYDARFETLSSANWTDDMIPASEFIDLPDHERTGRRPYILAVDERNRLWRRIPDEELLRVAAGYSRKWRRLQELGGIHNSHARQLLERERSRWEEANKTAAPPAPETAGNADIDNGATAEARPETGRPASDEPFIETSRCTSCEECIKINNRLFAYNENKQAFIADLNAGTYADLVRAAENCQVSIIHPGQPKNPNEPDLDTLIERAKPFL